MSFRAVTIGLLAGVLIASLTYINDWQLRLYWLVANHLPVSVYGLVLLLVLVGNPLLARLGGLGFDRRELAVMISLALVGAALGGAGLFRNFPNVVTAPLMLHDNEPTWQRTGAMGYVPSAMLPDAQGAQFNRTITPMMLGMHKPGQPDTPIAALPWDSWAAPAAFWGLLIVLLLGGMIALGLLLHRQWSRHELLQYPIAEFASQLTDTDGRHWPGVFRRRGFWVALLAVLAMHLVNGYHSRNPNMILIPTTFDFSPVASRFPSLGQSVGGWDLLYPELYISAVAFVFFMRSDAAFSMGISALLMAVLSAMLISRGVEFAGNQARGGYLPWLSFGSYFGLAMMIAYTGRNYFGRVLRRAVWPVGNACEPAYGVWACRALLACMGGVVAMLAWAGCAWTVGLLFVIVLLVLMVVIARISAETGLFHIGLIWSPLAVLVGLMGASAAGPVAMVTVGLIGAALLMDPREAMLPFVVNSLRLCDRAGAPLGRTSLLMTLALLIALPAGMMTVMWTQYNFGRSDDNWSTDWTPHLVFDTAAKEISHMNAIGQLKTAENRTPLGRLAAIRPSRNFLLAAGIGLALVLGVGAARLRWSWWPIHPVLFVVWGTWAMQKLAPSILLGWIIRTAVVRVAGGHKLRDLRTIAVGAIAGDLLGTLLWMVDGAMRYFLTGIRPPIYNPYTG